LIESVLQSLAQWPPLLVYGLIALCCVVENFFPPSPSDVFVAMAAFLSHQGNYDPPTIALTAWVAGVAGAAGVYAVARRHADAFGGSRLGRKLLPPGATGFLLKEYGRYGVFGIMITRMLPGFRSVVAPFAGLVGLPWQKTLIPVAAACAIWYAALTWIGARLGSEWDAIVRVLDGLNRALGAIALAVLAALVAGVIWWKRKRRAAPPPAG